MAMTHENIESEIQWFNKEVNVVKDKFLSWLIELAYKVSIREIEITKN